MNRFHSTFQSELTYLRDLGREFSRTNPSLSRNLAAEGGDPDVERLLEGFAFLSAKIRQRAEDAVPELCEALTDILLPHYLRSLPATSIVEFSPNPGTLRSCHRVPAGTSLASTEVEGTSCLFRTTAPVDLLPLDLQSAVLDDQTRTSPLLRLKFRAPDHARRLLAQQASVRLFLHGSLPLCSTLCLWFARHLEDVRWVSQEPNAVAVARPVPRTAIRVLFEDIAMRPTATDEEALSLWPWPDAASIGPRLLQEYFTLPNRALFIEISDLAKLDPDAHSESLELQIRFSTPPPLPEPLPERTFRLHCTPVVNLFAASADPIRKELSQDAQLIRVGGLPFPHAEVHSVDQVIGSRAGGGGRITYQPLSAFSRWNGVHGGREANHHFYSVMRKQSPMDGAVDTYLRIGSARDSQPDLREEVLSLELTCTNRLLPASLRTGDICKSTENSPRVATFTNITGVSKPIAPALGSETYWRLLSHLGAHPRSIGQAKRLRTMVGLYNFQAGIDVQAGRMNEKRTSAIRSVVVEPTHRLMGGIPARGVAVRVELDEEGFASIGDAYLFGCALRPLLSDYTSINTFLTLDVQLHPSMAVLNWEASCDEQTLL